MFIQIKSANGKQYIYIIESFRKQDGTISHRTLKKLGRLDEFIKNDPLALEKLKAQVKESSKELKQAQTMENMAKINAVYSNRSVLNQDEGLPLLNYANFLIKSIWHNILDLDYRLNYLQNHYHKELDFNLSQTLLREVTSRILDLDNFELEYGRDFAFLADDYEIESEKKNLVYAQNILSEEQMRIVSFIVKKLSEQNGLEFLNHSISTLKIEASESLSADLKLGDNQSIEINAEELAMKAKVRAEKILSTLVMIIMQVIRTKLEKRNLNYSFGDIRKALRNACVIVCCPATQDGNFSYIKANNGHYARLMNEILKAFELDPVLNIQDRIELSKRLHTKFKYDEVIIPQNILKNFTNKNIKDNITKI